jgi:pyruvate kinase
LNRPALTPKDHADLAFALRQRLSYVAISFVQSAADVRSVKAAVHRAGEHMPVIAKIEKPEAIDDLDNILVAADGVMIARGDLGVELGPEKVPVLQKRIIARAHAHNLPVITATQMLESMTVNPRPTRAEASDVANAVFDNTDAVMLSAETATGTYPVETVHMMHRLIREAETEQRRHRHAAVERRSSVSEAICDAVVKAAEELNIKAVAAFTEYGKTAQQISIYRPRPPIIAFSSRPVTVERLAICWGIYPRLIPPVRHIEMLSRHAERVLRAERVVRRGDVVAIVAGTPLGVPGHTNFLKLLTIGR